MTKSSVNPADNKKLLSFGEMGCPERTIYTVPGDVVNVGARFCGRAPGGKLLIDRATLDACCGFIQGELIHDLELKGLEGEDIEIFQVIE